MRAGTVHVVVARTVPRVVLQGAGGGGGRWGRAARASEHVHQHRDGQNAELWQDDADAEANEWTPKKHSSYRGTKKRGGAAEQQKRKQFMSTPEFQTALTSFFKREDTPDERRKLARVFGGAAFADMQVKRDES